MSASTDHVSSKETAMKHTERNDISLHSMDALDALGRVVAALRLAGLHMAARELQRDRDELATRLHSLSLAAKRSNAPSYAA